MTVWRLIKKLERAAWARKYSELQDARAELAEVFGPAPASELLEADHRYTTREIDRIAREPSPNTVRERLDEQRRRLVRCTTCKMMREIPTGTVCSLCLSNVAAAFELRSGLQAQLLAERPPLERSTTPMFSSKVPTSSRALRLDDLRAFVDLTKLPTEITTPLTVDDVAKHYLDTRNAEPMCEHGVTAVTCYECSRSTLRRYRKHERPQSGGSCDCPRDARDCTRSELECRVRSFHNGRLTVRSWFRKMRAAEFERDLPGRERVPLVRSHASMYEPWTLFDTQKVVNRETAANYVRFPDDWTGSERAAWRRLFEPFYDGTR